MVEEADRSLVAVFAALPDPRPASEVLSPLPEIMVLLLCATLACADDVVEIALWGRRTLAFLRRRLRCQHGIPSHDRLGEVVAALDAGLFRDGFATWVAGLRQAAPADPAERAVIARDGKTARRSHARRKGGEPLHLLSAWACRQRLVLGQQAVDDRSNEITAIPVLPERLEPAGALVTSDAIGTRIAVAQTIRARGGGSLLALKADRPRLLAELETVFATPPPEMAIETHQTVDGEHGRIETRRHAVCHPPNRLFADRRSPDQPRFPDLAMIGMVEPETERTDGNTDRERRSHLCPARLEAQTFARAVRPRWGIENRLHWALEVVCRDDLARLRSGHGPANMAVVKHIALNLLQQAKPTTRLNNRRKLAGWRTDYLNPLIRGAA